jgi:hypothetical protein
MERKTMTTLGELRIGDRFVYPKANVVWQVIGTDGKKNNVAVNQMNSKNEPIYKHHHFKKPFIKVLFLRHTVILPQEECFIQDLQPGDIFCKVDDIVNEYELIEQGKAFSKVRRLDKAFTEMAGVLATVIYLSHKKEAKK